MKLNIVALTGLVALVASQDASSTTTSLTPQQSCATKCDPTDVCCNAACYQVPCPDNSMANETTECAAACPQGNGTADETAAYASCQQACFSSLFFTGTAATKATASGSKFVGDVSATATATSTGTGIADSNTNNAERTGSSQSSDSSATSTGSLTTESGSASQIGVQFGVAGVLGAMMAAFFL
ncbi:uncharacterized protein BHQ10_005408 [Talaromyces amestolkiae]|uniref:Extracellular membrane protein CFEM domain-containing protein n=1 Tax=Talaromyces amestolkiae TaxID=1196081 RepID=A0A364L0T1_TALAM|nr:uncharacterized protein BHQ10_005408 [Talaromyces amestolkiae]RAO69396.1 hypothetical protein BHQ10_005408 [Talaromyces amestolkiae]